MTRFLIATVVVAAMVCGCTQTPARPAPNNGDLVVLLPKPNGHIGGVVVRTPDGKEILLNQAYAGARIDANGKLESVTYSAAQAKQEFDAAVTALPERPVIYVLYYIEGKNEMTTESQAEIARISHEIAARTFPDVLVIGHGDTTGTIQFNDQLSLQRAQRVRDLLVQGGLDAHHVEAIGRGKREPAVPTSEGVSEQRNRRVEINVR
jgi:outer membrane protein OmpA-like peptidoglycan-associated protein